MIGSVVVSGLILLLSRSICTLFGADARTVEYTLQSLPLYSWGFIVMSVNVMISAYLYSTKRSAQAIAINVLRSLIVNTAVILLLPTLFGANAIWFTFGVYEAAVAVVAVILLKNSEKNGIVFQ